MSTNEPIRLLERKRYVAGLLELACLDLEISDTQWKAAEKAYESVTDWLIECPTLGQFDPYLSSQGSGALQTTVKPLTSEEFDVDVLGHLRLADDSIDHVLVKQAFGKRLVEYERRFGPTCSEYKRCWRLDYAEGTKMHIDITPAVNHTTSRFRDLAVPDRVLMRWEESNPPDYIRDFKRVAELRPRFTSELFEFTEKAARAEVEPLPGQTPLKGYLRRIVQLLKRHRSVYFEGTPKLAPISVIITTLAMRAYERLVHNGKLYESEFDVICDVIELMPSMIERGGEDEWLVMNHTTESENFAEKWNLPNSNRAAAFFEWQKAAFYDFKELADTEDPMTSAAILDRIVGGGTGKAVRKKEASLVERGRDRNSIAITKTGMLSASAGISVPRNTFFGN